MCIRPLLVVLGAASVLGACGNKSSRVGQGSTDARHFDLAPDIITTPSGVEAGENQPADASPDVPTDTPAAQGLETGKDQGAEPEAGAGPETGTTRPDSVLSNAALYFADDSGVWSVGVDSPPTLVVDRGGRAGLYPSPFLDRLAIARQGQGTEIYDRQARLLGWLPSESFAGWTSNETVVAGMAKWDVQGQSLRPFSKPVVSDGIPGTYSIGGAAVSPDGRWLAVREGMNWSARGMYLYATNDGAKSWKITQSSGSGLFWARGGGSVGLFEDGVAALDADFTGTSKVVFTTPRPICAGQAFVGDTTFLVWTYKPYADMLICADPYVVDAANPAAAPAHLVPKAPFASSPTWDARTALPFAISPDGKQIAYASGDAGKGIVIAAPDGSAPHVVAAGRTILGLAWDSQNPRAPAFDPDRTTAAQPDGGAVEIPSLPGPSGAQSATTDCTKGVWYKRAPSPLPSNWPEPRSMAAHAFDRDRGLLVLDGGYDYATKSNVAPANTTWEWNGGTGTWTNRSPATPPRPTPRSGHGMAYDSKRKALISMGDQNVWLYTPATNTWTLSPCQGPWWNTGAHSVLYEPDRDDLFLASGGHEGATLTLAQCTQQTLALPTPPDVAGVQVGVEFVYDSRRKTVWQLGGYKSDSTPRDARLPWVTYADAPNGPRPRSYTALAFDEDRGRVMMFSGLRRDDPAGTTSASISYPADLWEWNPDDSSWTLCSSGASGLLARTDANLAYDPGRHALILFGGEGHDASGNSTGSLADLWEWAIP